jgi:hypothetical protein
MPKRPSRPLHVPVLPQPSPSVCGPTCLHAVYRFFGKPIPLAQILSEVPELPEGGTLAVQLGAHALAQGFSATIFTTNLQTFDPTWFRPGLDLKEKLRAQRAEKQDEKLQLETDVYLRFLSLGGQVKLQAPSLELLRSFIDRGIPVMTGLSSTYLYDCQRELPDGSFDDVRGDPTGHFVVVRGYDSDSDNVLVADPLPDNPGFEERYYSVDLQRLLAAILLGIVTYDANLLVVEPSENT